jgi:magnesium chelatase subunit D
MLKSIRVKRGIMPAHTAAAAAIACIALSMSSVHGFALSGARFGCAQMKGIGALRSSAACPRAGRASSLRMVAADNVAADAEERAKMAEELEKALANEGMGSAYSASELNLPLSMVVGQAPIKTALLLAAVNPKMGGVVIAGGRGTGKSVMARAMHRLLPPIEVIKGSKFNIDPENQDNEVDDFLLQEMAEKGQTLADRETEIIECPFVTVPLNVLDDRLLGSVDVEESVKQGRTVFEPGLLAKAHRGVLYVDDINLLDNEIANILLSVVSDGWVNVEREGISVKYPCRPLLIATFNPEEAELRSHLLDRIAVSLSADANPLTVDDRVEATKNFLGFNQKSMTVEDKQDMEDGEQALKTRIIFAREELKETKIAPKQIAYLCGEASRAGVQGQRADLFAVEVARANAALNDRPVNSDDLKLAVKLVIAPRSKYMQMDNNEDEMMQMPPPPPPPSMEQVPLHSPHARSQLFSHTASARRGVRTGTQRSRVLQA